MNEEQKDKFFDLLTNKAVYGLDEAEQLELDSIDPGTGAEELRTLEMTTAAIGLAGLSELESMPSHLRARIIAESHDHLALLDTIHSPARTVESDVTERVPLGSWFGWMGWIAAAAAFSALFISMFVLPRGPRTPLTAVQPPTATPTPLSIADQRERLIASAPDVVHATWAAGNVSGLKDVTGDVVWSDQKQAGYLKFHGLPVNDAAQTCYQLWIFDQTQDKATPIDGGIFDVTSDGDLVVPINAKLQAVKPEMFALTIERHGGVVVSKRDRVAALAKVESQPS